MLRSCRSPLVMLALLTTLCAAQDPDATPLPDLGNTNTSVPKDGGKAVAAPPVELPGMRAHINGHAITTHDVLVEARVMMILAGTTEKELENPPEEKLNEALANAAREIVLSSEAERLGLKLTEYELDELMKQYFGSVPDLDALAKLTGTTPETMRARFRRQIMATLYTRHRLGRDFRYAHLIQPDPFLKRLMEVRPSELKREFERRREQLAVPPSVRYRIQAFADRDSAARGIEALELGREPLSDRRAQEWTEPEETAAERVRYLTRSPELAKWILEAPAGAVSDAAEVSDDELPLVDDDSMGPPQVRSLFLVIQVLERLPAREADFALDQELLQQTLERENIERARRALILDEARKAVVWPPELFS